MMMLSEFVTDAEYSNVLEGVKDLLKETYQISDNEAISVIIKSREQADEYVNDYIPYVNHMRDIQDNLRGTLDTHIQQAVDQEKEMHIKMSNDAAVWLAFECIRRFCKQSF
jgi:uncharacterized tellurite resistance protein B-like protein